jgi:replicative DNA helicase
MARPDYPTNTLSPEDQEHGGLPRNRQAEQAVIGAALLSPVVLKELLEMIEPGDLYEVRHEVIWHAIERLANYGHPVDAVSVSNELGRELAKCGGSVYLHDCMEAVPTAANGPYYAELLRDYAYARAVVNGGIRLTQMGRTEIEDDLKAAVRRELQSIAEADRRGWDQPVPLHRIRTVPDFPINALPKWVRAKAEVTAYQTQTPVDLAGSLALATLATVAGGIVRVDVRPEHGWSEPTNLYVVAALPPASRKSPVFNAMTAPILAAEAQLQAEAKTRIIELSVERKAAEDYAVRIADKLAKAPPGESDSLRYEAQQAALAAEAIAVPPVPRLFTDDATAETACSLLVEQDGKFAVLSAESEVFNEMAGRYSGNPNMNVFLKGHAGDPIRVDRKGRASEAIDQPALTLGICTQPSALVDLAAVPGAAGRGLLARFLFTIPPSNIGYRDSKPGPVDKDVHLTYATKLHTLIDALRRRTEPVHLTLGGKASLLLDQVAEATETELREGGKLAGYTDWGGKAVGAMMRIAGLLHVAEHGTAGFQRPISAETMTSARDLISYYTEHSLAVFETMTTDDVAERAGSVLTNLTNNATTRFTARDLFRSLSRSRFPKMTDLEAALTLLEQHGYLRRLQSAPAGPRGGRPGATVYEAHPDLSS